jgi:hypothetical protein
MGSTAAGNEKWSVTKLAGSYKLLQTYSRPVYNYVSGLPTDLAKLNVQTYIR